MTRIEEEKKTVRQMVEIYCKWHHPVSAIKHLIRELWNVDW